MKDALTVNAQSTNMLLMAIERLYPGILGPAGDPAVRQMSVRQIYF